MEHLYKVSLKHVDGKPLTTKQRMSPHFEVEPRIGHHVLRKAKPYIVFTDVEMNNHEVRLKQLLSADMISIDRFEREGQVKQPTKHEEPVKQETSQQPVAPVEPTPVKVAPVVETPIAPAPIALTQPVQPTQPAQQVSEVPGVDGLRKKGRRQ